MQIKYYTRCFAALLLLLKVFRADAACGNTINLTSHGVCAGIQSIYVTGAGAATGVTFVTGTYGFLFNDSGIDTVYNGINGNVSAGTYVAIVTFAGGCADTSNALTILPVVTPTISIVNTGSDTVCHGNALTFTATGTNGGSAPVYQWLVNGANAGTNSSTFTGNFNNTDLVWCSYKNNDQCGQGPAVSNQIRITVDDQRLLSITPVPDCNRDTLTVHGATTATSIIWRNNGVALDTVSATSFNRIIRAGTGLLFQGSPFEPGDIYVDSAGDIYLSDYEYNRVLFFPQGSTSLSQGKTIAGGNGAGSSARQLYGPGSICLDSKKNLYVVDALNQRIQKFPAGSDSTTNGITVINSGAGIIRMDIYDNLYVEANGSVNKYDANSIGVVNGSFVITPYATGMAVSRYGDVYVADEINNNVMFYDGTQIHNDNYQPVIVAGGNGAGNGANQLNKPQGIFLDIEGNLYVEDNLNNRIQKFAYGSTQASNAVTVTPYSFDYIHYSDMGFSMDGHGDLYIADSYFNDVVEFVQGTDIDSIYVPASNGDYQAIVQTAGGCSTQILQGPVSNLSEFQPAVIQLSSDTLQTILSDTVPIKWYWYYNGQLLTADTGLIITATGAGTYSAVGIDTFGCQTIPGTLNYSPAGLTALNTNNNINVYPNPGDGSFMLQTTNALGAQYTIYNASGNALQTGAIQSNNQSIILNGAAPGLYLLMLNTKDGNVPVKFGVVNR